MHDLHFDWTELNLGSETLNDYHGPYATPERNEEVYPAGMCHGDLNLYPNA